VDARFLIEREEPLARRAWRRGELPGWAEAALRELACCRACPHACKIDRLAGKTAACFTGRHAVVSSAFPHFGEEDCLRGWRGSGTIFFGRCNLRGSSCQNWDISQQRAGREMTAQEIASLKLELQDVGRHNIHVVTPEHVAPQVIEAIAVAVPCGLELPIVYNTSAYDALSSLRLLDGRVDIYPPDLKFWEPESSGWSGRPSSAPRCATGGSSSRSPSGCGSNSESRAFGPPPTGGR
jgi:putative pyruvate formate lyase activating enzyme